MDIHQNARLTLRSREALVEIVRGGVGLSRAAAGFHVTPKTAAKWVRRYLQEGAAGLRDRSSRPITAPEPLRLAGWFGFLSSVVSTVRLITLPARPDSAPLREPHPAPGAAQPLARSASLSARSAL